MTPLPPWLEEKETNALANWKCKCGRGPSFEHPVNGHCSARAKIERLEEALTIAWEALEKIRDAAIVRSPSQAVPPEIYNKMWRRSCFFAKEAMRQIEELGE